MGGAISKTIHAQSFPPTKRSLSRLSEGCNMNRRNAIHHLIGDEQEWKRIIVTILVTGTPNMTNAY
jgi:hypothetical protein